MQRLGDFRLTHTLGVKRALGANDEELDEVLATVCRNFWNATLDDIPAEAFWDLIPRLDEDEAIEFGASQGFDFLDDEEWPFPDWPSFAVMTWAAANGMLKIEYRWQAEAEALTRKNRQLYRISSYEQVDGHGYAWPEGRDGDRVFLHRSALQRAGVSRANKDDLFMLEVDRGPKGPYARAVHIASSYEIKAAQAPKSRRVAIEAEYE